MYCIVRQHINEVFVIMPQAEAAARNLNPIVPQTFVSLEAAYAFGHMLTSVIRMLEIENADLHRRNGDLHQQNKALVKHSQEANQVNGLKARIKQLEQENKQQRKAIEEWQVKAQQAQKMRRRIEKQKRHDSRVFEAMTRKPPLETPEVIALGSTQDVG